MSSISIRKAEHEITHDKIVNLLFMVMLGRIYTIFIQDNICDLNGFFGYAVNLFHFDFSYISFAASCIPSMKSELTIK